MLLPLSEEKGSSESGDQRMAVFALSLNGRSTLSSLTVETGADVTLLGLSVWFVEDDWSPRSSVEFRDVVAVAVASAEGAGRRAGTVSFIWRLDEGVFAASKVAASIAAKGRPTGSSVTDFV